MGARRRRVAVGTAATFLLLAACGGDDEGEVDSADTLATVDTTASTVVATTTSSTSTTSTTVPPTTTAPPDTTVATTAPRTTVPSTTTGALVLSWTSSGAPARACFEPGDTVPDLVVDRTPDSEPFDFQVDIIDWQFDPFAVAPLTWTVDYSDDRVLFTFEVDESAPRPWSVELTLGYSVQGTQVFVTDEPEIFRWSFEETCG